MNAGPNFAKDVARAFSSILHNYGYCVTYADDFSLRFDSQVATIEVHYDHGRSYEVDVTFDLLRNGTSVNHVPFNLGEVYREFEVPNASNCWFFQSTDYSKVLDYLSGVCCTLQSCCHRLLQGDQDAFQAVKNRRNREAARYTRQVQFEAAKLRATRAWSEKRYRDYIDLMRDFHDIMSESERAKLTYSLAHMDA